MRRIRRSHWGWGGLIVAAMLVCAARFSIGTSALGLPEDVGWVVAELRMNRLLVAGVAGAALGIAGVALQALLRNPLAEPFILGLSTGAGAGIVAQRLLLASLGFSGWSAYPGSLAGAGATMLIVYLASRRRGGIDPLGLLLTGVVLSTINGALIMLAVHLRPGLLRVEVSEWMMGYLDAGTELSWRWALAAAATLSGLIWMVWRSQSIDVAVLSEPEAVALGINVDGLRRELFVVSSVLASAAVVLAGPVAFVGLICPHLSRLIFGSRHRSLVVASAMLGGTLVVCADLVGALCALIFGVGVVPLGIFTAFVGGLSFLWMLRRHGGRP